jgi:transcriptional regulator with XRE-family HTH domain
METQVALHSDGPEPRAAREPGAQPNSLSELLRAELVRRCRQNPAYSLRAFAKSLGFSPAFVSKLLHGKRRFTDATIRRIGERLALSPAELEPLRSPPTDVSVAPELPAYREIRGDQFQLIADWYHFAILELTTLEGFEASPRWIARKIGINQHQAADALTRLERLGYLTRDRHGRLRLGAEHNTTDSPDLVRPAARQQQAQFLDLAAVALQEVPFELRSQTGMTMAIPADRVGEAVAAIGEFRRKLTAQLQRPGARTAVYQLSISFFPLTK